MEFRTHMDLRVSEVGVGCYALSGVYGTKDTAEFKRMLQRAHELGVNFFDTAETYGDAERILGDAIKCIRHEVYVATKVGIRGGLKPNLSSSHVKKACEESLKRLQTDYIDLYQVHFDDPDTPIEETVGALEELVQEGKIRHYGVGHLPPARVEAHLRAGEVFSVLLELSAVARESRKKLLPLCGAYGTRAIAFSVTGRGLLTGRFGEQPRFEPGDIRNIDPLFQRERSHSGRRVAEKMAELGKHYGKTPAQVAISWVLSQPGVLCALVGSSTVAHLEENVGGAGWVLSAKDLEGLERFLQREDQWLERKQRSSLGQILRTPLPRGPSRALTDLVYALETALSLGLASEGGIFPIAQELYGMWKAVDEVNRPQLEAAQSRLRDMIDMDKGGLVP